MKVLIISHTPMTGCEAMGKTMVNLFSSFQREELCQLYIYPTLPDAPYCSSFFRLTDKDVLRSYFSFFRVKGSEIPLDRICASNTLFEDGSDEGLYRSKKNKTGLRMFLRDAMWRHTRWYNRALRDYLDREKPSVIFVAPGSGVFLYRIALRIAKDYRLPIVTYVCDDYYFIERPRGLFARLHHKGVLRATERLMKKTSRIVTISPSLEKTYTAHFGVPAETVMTGAGFPIAAHPLEARAPKGITYLGNIRYNRYRSLCEIGAALDRLNETNGTDYTLDIYSGEKSDEILSALQEHRSIRFHGYVGGQAFLDTLFSADYLLHVESFDSFNADLVKHSVSTKIADSLASGIPFLAYAPASVASMQHLLTQNCALTATDPSELPALLEKAFLSGFDREETVMRAIEAAQAHHDTERNSHRLYAMLREVSR